ncbi:putative glutamine synthetase translation inhibitor GstI-like protein [Ancylobacter novellus DSM 506]|uniref:Glutamine synthetase translation inhibitor GstI-like protein n=1 Tax=Ancylobacter novellus (strain ATCC 8093 / DSM 506 / JCM 20403 / CCM 1077 / IAM 12100 / NBRC 12443 / NCIMB 10456) TaxID=639283 RepID=D7A328_ANCN5|nr:DUF2735 domain-containing protein [Ancylobacter novellus]ADH87746.1 putative glutamine synthetase translation inhibitor GstI-like protein [Ancylobacter novellus DSM 506]
MRTNIQRASAQIVQFPVGGRAGLAARRAELRASEPLKVNPAVIFGSWYHEEAIREDAGPKN